MYKHNINSEPRVFGDSEAHCRDQLPSSTSTGSQLWDQAPSTKCTSTVFALSQSMIQPSGVMGITRRSCWISSVSRTMCLSNSICTTQLSGVKGITGGWSKEYKHQNLYTFVLLFLFWRAGVSIFPKNWVFSKTQYSGFVFFFVRMQM